MKERAHLGDLSVGEKIILKKDIKETGLESVDWTHIA